MILAGGESQQDVDREDADRVNAHMGTYSLSSPVIATAKGWTLEKEISINYKNRMPVVEDVFTKEQ